MATNSVEKMLEDLADLKERRDLATSELDAKIRELEEQRAILSAPLDETIGRLEKSIESSVVSMGQSVKGSRLYAVYYKPRVTWDSKGLGGYMVAHPEIEAFQKVGSPSVSIRNI